MKKVSYLSLSVLFFITIIAAGCSNKASEQPSKAAPSEELSATPTASTPPTVPENSPKEQVEISWYLHNQATPEDRKITEDVIVKNFETAHPDIKIKVVYNADPDTLTKQQLAAGGGPDVIMTDGPSTLKQYAAANYLLPLEDYSKKFGWDQLFEPWAYDTVKHDGKLMGIPGAYETLVVYYNKDMFKANGWNVPANYDELMKLCKAMQDKGIIPFAFGSSDFKTANEWWLSEAYNQTLGADEFKKVLTGESLWNSDLMTEATTKLVDMWQKGYISNKQSAAITIDNATTLFLSKKAAMKMEGTWLLSGLIDKKPGFDWGMFQMPAWRDGVKANFPLALGDATGINKNTKHPDQVAQFLDFLNRPDVIKSMIPRGQFHPVNGVDVRQITDIDPHVKEAYTLLKSAIDQNGTGYAAWTYWPPAVETYAWGNIESVFYKQTDLKAYLEKCVQEFQKDKTGGKLFKF
jgi:raffinose/stachyose/melibiose transport system substrate-binding protein